MEELHFVHILIAIELPIINIAPQNWDRIAEGLKIIHTGICNITYYQYLFISFMIMTK